MINKADISPIPELKGLSGGKKHHWMRIHHDDLVAFHAEHGDQATMKRYGFKLRTTLLNNLRPIHQIPGKMSKADRAMHLAEIAIESGYQTRGEIRKLRADFNEFVPRVAGSVTTLFIEALKRIELPAELEHKQHDPLRITDFRDGEAD